MSVGVDPLFPHSGRRGEERKIVCQTIVSTTLTAKRQIPALLPTQKVTVLRVAVMIPSQRELDTPDLLGPTLGTASRAGD